MPRQDFEWLFTFDRSSAQGQLDVLTTMKPTTEFGALFQYSNPLASAAGYIGARLLRPDLELGQAYDVVMREKVLHPLGMSRTTFSFDEALGTSHASPHSWDMSLKNVPIEIALNQRDWKVPPDPFEVRRLARSYRNAALGEIVVRAGQDEVVFQFGGWKSPMASKLNPDGTTSFVSVAPGVRGFEFNAPAATGAYTRLRLRDPQHTYDYESVGAGVGPAPSSPR